VNQRTRGKTLAERLDERDQTAGANGHGPRRASVIAKAADPEPPPAVETFTAADLMRMQLPEPRWAVNGIIPEGLSILAGKPKLGKSWMALNIALAVATGGTALGSIAVEQGDVLYLALEDTKRRLQGRLDKLLNRQNAAAPERLTFATHWPRQDKGGLAALTEWLESHPEARLVVIDTWARFKPGRLHRANEYEEDYQHAGELKAAADKEGLAVLPIHHCRKMGAADALEEVSGSVGLTGAADAILVLRRERGQLDASLHVTGRDVEEQELALGWTPEYCQWSILGQADEHRMGKDRAEVVALLRKVGRAMKPSEAAPLLGKTVGAARKLFWSMGEAGQVKALGEGFYALGSNVGNSSNASNAGNVGNAPETEAVTGLFIAGNAAGNAVDEPHYQFPK
jgi:AAA domain